MIRILPIRLQLRWRDLLALPRVPSSPCCIGIAAQNLQRRSGAQRVREVGRQSRLMSVPLLCLCVWHLSLSLAGSVLTTAGPSLASDVRHAWPSCTARSSVEQPHSSTPALAAAVRPQPCLATNLVYRGGIRPGQVVQAGEHAALCQEGRGSQNDAAPH